MKIEKINGYNVLAYNNDHNLCTIQIVVNAGSHSESSENLWGAAHYLEHMSFKGTEFKHYKEINKNTSRLGDINAYTSEDTTVYHISCRKEKVLEALNMILEMLFYPKFDEKEFNKEKMVILEEYNSGMNDPSRFFWSTVYEKFRNSHWIIGNKESITNMTVDFLKDFRKNNYTKSNILFTVIGGIDEERIKKEFKIYFNTVEEILEKCPELTVAKLGDGNVEGMSENLIELIPNLNEEKVTHKSDQAYFAMITEGMPSIENFNANYVASVFSNAFGGGMHSLLFDRIREELGYCYSTGVWYHTFANGTSNYSIYAALDKKNIPTTIDEVNRLIKGVKEEGIVDELLRTSKDNLLYHMARTYETSAGLSCMAACYFDNKRFTTLDEKAKKIESITNEDIIEFANGWMKDFKTVIMCNA